MNLPDFLVNGIKNNKTSLGEHPSYPPDEEISFVGYILTNMYNNVMSYFDKGDISPKKISNTLNKLVSECHKLELDNKEALENLCTDICAKIFNIPDDTINIESKLVEECDMSKYRMTPESTVDFSFDDIDEMNSLSDEIYKRRMIDALIAGASMFYSCDILYYAEEIKKINPKLLRLYLDIIMYNTALLYNQPDTIKNIERSNSGKVDVFIGDIGQRITIKAEGVIFPVLLEYTIRGLLETAAQNGLPNDEEKAKYILSKSDFRLAENWDMRLGIPLWNILVENVEQCNEEIDNIGCNFIIMELSRLSPDKFNLYLKNAFKKTKKGLSMTKELIDTIQYNKEADKFNNFIKVKNNKYTINDDNEYTSDELLSEIEK